MLRTWPRRHGQLTARCCLRRRPRPCVRSTTPVTRLLVYCPVKDMANEAVLPELLDPLLDYLSSNLPPQIYSVFESLLYYLYTLAASAVQAGVTIVKTPPASWDAQKILPPLITLLASYLALLSFYRTTGWMIRTAFAFVKWGFLLSALGAAAGYFLANANIGGDVGAIGAFGAGIVSSLGAMILAVLNGDSTNSASSASSKKSTRTRAGQRQHKQKPNAWDSWDRHREWQYSEHAGQGAGQGEGVQEVIGNILGTAGKAVRESGWWEAAKAAVDEFTKNTPEDGSSAGKAKSKPKGKGTSSR